MDDADDTGRRATVGWNGMVATIAVALFACVLSQDTASAQNARAARATVLRMRNQIRDAGKLYQKGAYDESAALIREVQTGMDKLAEGGDAAVLRMLKGVYASLKQAHGLLEIQGVEMPPLVEPGKKATPKPDGAEGAGGAVTFTKHVAPMLVAKCGRCHVNNARGGLSLASYSVIMRGGPDGKIVFPKDADGSRLVEVIESGDMPRGGGKVAPQELAMLKQWITEGATFDGQNEDQPITGFTAATPDAGAKVEPQLATGKETVSFSRQIAPIVAEQCGGCHGNGQRVRGGFNLATFAAMLQGGDSGPPVLPGKPAESLLIRKLRGEAEGQRMPQGRPPLSEDQIQLVSTWIREGATFDGPDLAQNVRDVAEVAQAMAATHDELAEMRQQRSNDQWELSLPGVSRGQAMSDNFLLLGQFSENTLQQDAETAEQLAGKITTLFGQTSEGPWIKGRTTIFLLRRRYDYAEFGKMVEGRDLPADQSAHSRFDVVDAYVAMARPSEDAKVQSEFAEQLAATYLRSLGAPRWFAEGGGRLAAERLGDDEAGAAAWKSNLSAAVASLQKPDDAIAGRLAPESNRLVNYGFVKFLMKDPRRVASLLRRCRAGDDFTRAFSDTYRASPAQLVPLWLRNP